MLERNYSGKTHNNHLSNLRAMFAMMCEKNRSWMPTNPFSGIKKLPEDVGKNIAYTQEEKKTTL